MKLKHWSVYFALLMGTCASSYAETLTLCKDPETGVRLAVGDSIRKGEHELTEGLSQLVFENKVEILIEAPAWFRIGSAQHLTLFEGRLSAVVSPEGVGITVVTPNAEVVDLGTKFVVEVLAAEYSEIHVFKGEVEVKPRERSIEAIRLLTDQATRMDEAQLREVGLVNGRSRPGQHADRRRR